MRTGEKFSVEIRAELPGIMLISMKHGGNFS